MNRFSDIQEQAYDANMQINNLGLVLFTFGNVSAADRNKGVFAIKPSGVPYSDLSVNDLVIVDFSGQVVQGSLRPSSDTLTHAVLYSNWEGVSGVAHTHSTYATAWAQALQDIPILGTTHADHLTTDIPCAPPMSDAMIEGDYEEQTGFQIVNELKKRELSPLETGMILVGSHAPFTWGETAEKAVYNSAVLEEIAKMAFLSRQIHSGAPRLKNSLITKHYDRKHGGDSYYGQENRG